MVAGHARNATGKELKDLPLVELTARELPQDELIELYRASDAFVLPTRGEGWGLPIVEAIALGLPTIATNFSGPAAYLTAQGSFPLQVDGVDDEGFAIPSLAHLKQLLRFVFEGEAPRDGGRGEAAATARAGRAEIHERYNPTRVAGMVNSQLWAAAMQGSM